MVPSVPLFFEILYNQEFIQKKKFFSPRLCNRDSCSQRLIPCSFTEISILQVKLNSLGLKFFFDSATVRTGHRQTFA